MFGSSTAHKAIRRMLVDDHKLDAAVKLPSGVFKPYAGVSTEPPRVCRRPFGLSYAAMTGASGMG